MGDCDDDLGVLMVAPEWPGPSLRKQLDAIDLLREGAIEVGSRSAAVPAEDGRQVPTPAHVRP